MSDTGNGFMDKILWRLKKDGGVNTIQYLLNRSSIREQQALAEKEASSWNDHFFESLGIQRETAEALLEETRQKIPVLEEDVHVKSQQPQSTHLLAFAALKVAGFSPKNILEIGTYLGFTTSLLSHLYPEATIHTVALPSDDPVFEDYHIIDGQGVDNIFEQRLQRPNINVIKKNSGFLWEVDLPDFDLIWLDGGHQYPVVAWDHFYSLSKLASNGWLFSDDIVIPEEGKKTEYDPRYHAYHAVEYYSQRLKDKFNYLLKREDAATYLHAKKFVAYLNKKN